MHNDVIHTAMATWAAKDLAARLDVTETAKLLGFPEHDIQVLMASGKLIPLGDPAPNSPKWFAAIEIIRLAADQAWLHKATKDVARYWRNKRERQQSRRQCTQHGPSLREKSVSPKSSPRPSPNEHCAGDEAAMTSDERTAVKSACNPCKHWVF